MVLLTVPRPPLQTPPVVRCDRSMRMTPSLADMILVPLYGQDVRGCRTGRECDRFAEESGLPWPRTKSGTPICVLFVVVPDDCIEKVRQGSRSNPAQVDAAVRAVGVLDLNQFSSMIISPYRPPTEVYMNHFFRANRKKDGGV